MILEYKLDCTGHNFKKDWYPTHWK